MFRSTYTILAFVAVFAVTSFVILRATSPSPPVESSTATNPTAQVDGGRGWAAAPGTAASDAVDLEALAASLVEQGRAAIADGDLKRGFDSYRRAVEYNPTAETHGLVGDLYLRMAVLSDASFHLRRAAELDAENADRWIALANAYFLSTDPIAAAKALDRAKQLDPTIVIERDNNNFVVRGHTGLPARDS